LNARRRDRSKEGVKTFMKLLILPFALSLTLALVPCLPVSAEETIEKLIADGGVFDEDFQPAEALKFYLPAEKMEPENVDVLLRIARQYRHLMQDAEEMGEKLKLGATAKSYAQKAVNLEPKNAETHLSMAICHAKMVPILGTRERMEASVQIKASVDKALELNPKQDLAWNILGCWHQKLADIGMMKRALAKVVYGGLPEASNDEAVKCLEKAIELNPNRLIHYIELGRTYAQMGREEEAKTYIEKGLAMPNIGKDDPEQKRRGRETLAAIN
jgi:tetratricopeptide (TPR) repeat protein